MNNGSTRDARFGIHEGAAGQWRRVIDTSLPSPADIVDPGSEPVVSSNYYRVQPRGIVVLLR
jgi:glycogen operon protein